MDAQPIDSLDDLWAWKPPTQKAHVKRLENFSRRDGPEVMLCHDMKGGYLEEEGLSGYCVPSDSHPFVFLHWWQIDVFCYFSHHLITVPPVGWTNLAHMHGVRMMGTFITEWDEGKKICSEFLGSEENMDRVVEKLVLLAKEWNFEGWLINIENTLEMKEIPKMAAFLRKLTYMMRKEISNSQVIWYDSVISSGELKWQNALNADNEIFYENCDGIYLNYNWKNEHLIESAQRATKRGMNTVYAGIDCFSRGCTGGWDCATSFSLLSEHGLSVALFAPGWIVETMPDQEPISSGMRFWSLLSPHTTSRPLTKLPFRTNFYCGYKENGKWWCLDSISLQPHFASFKDGCVPLKATGGLLLENVATYTIFSMSAKLDPLWEVVVLASHPIVLLLNGEVVEETCDKDQVSEEEENTDSRKKYFTSVYPITSPILVTSLQISTRLSSTILYELEVRKCKLSPMVMAHE